jgi:hypothetical protein
MKLDLILNLGTILHCIHAGKPMISYVMFNMGSLVFFRNSNGISKHTNTQSNMDKEKNMWMHNKIKQITNINFEFWIIDFTIQYLSK